MWEHFSIDLDADLDGDLREPVLWRSGSRRASDDRWAAYVIGVVQYCLQRAPDARRSPACVSPIESTVPEGKGVSSSAALEVATMAAVCRGYELATGAPRKSRRPASGRESHRWRAVRHHGPDDERVRPARSTAAAALPTSNDRRARRDSDGFRFYGIDSGVRHAVTGADYGTVRTAAFMGYRIIADVVGCSALVSSMSIRSSTIRLWHGYLANIRPRNSPSDSSTALPETMSGADFLTRYHGITDTVTRVDRATAVSGAAGDGASDPRAGSVSSVSPTCSASCREPRRRGANWASSCIASHASYSAIGLGSVGTDRLVDLVAAASPERGVFGAKITGGGSGGTVAVIGTDDAEATVREIAARYSAESGLPAEVFVESGPGAEETGVLLVE